METYQKFGLHEAFNNEHRGKQVNGCSNDEIMEAWTGSWRAAMRSLRVRLGEAVPSTTTLAVPLKMSRVRESAQMVFDRVAVCTGRCGRFSDRDSSAVAGEFENLHGKLRQVAKEEALALDLLLKTCFLML